MIDPVTAVSLGIKPALSQISTAPVEKTAAGMSDFSQMLNSFGETTVAKLGNAEQLSLDGMRGEASIREVADAVMSAEQALQAGIAVRDKIVTAYLEISRMAI